MGKWWECEECPSYKRGNAALGHWFFDDYLMKFIDVVCGAKHLFNNAIWKGN